MTAPRASAAALLAGLGRLRATRPEASPAARCEFCHVPIDDGHGHVADLGARSVMCACRACYLLFVPAHAGGGRYRSIPERPRRLPDAALRPDEWDALQIPVGVAFFFVNSAAGRPVALYPSPAGATESELSLESWAAIEERVPEVARMEPDVEALLIRDDDGRLRAYIVPIDACYELVGRIRRSWKGFDGGQEGRAEIDRFFVTLDSKAGTSHSEGPPG